VGLSSLESYLFLPPHLENIQTIVDGFPLIFSLIHIKEITKVETPIHDNIRELVTWECKEHGVKS
jgi:hypothetical protein